MFQKIFSENHLLMAAFEGIADTTKNENKRLHCQLNKKQVPARKFSCKIYEILLKQFNTEHLWEDFSVFLIEFNL